METRFVGIQEDTQQISYLRLTAREQTPLPTTSPRKLSFDHRTYLFISYKPTIWTFPRSFGHRLIAWRHLAGEPLYGYVRPQPLYDVAHQRDILVQLESVAAPLKRLFRQPRPFEYLQLVKLHCVELQSVYCLGRCHHLFDALARKSQYEMPAAVNPALRGGFYGTSCSGEVVSASYGLKRADASQIAGDPKVARFFEEAVNKAPKAVLTVANVIVNLVPATQAITAAQVASLSKLLAEDAITFAQAREVLEIVDGTNSDPAQVVDERGMRQSTDTDALLVTIDEVLARCADQVRQYKEGNKKVVGFLVGQCMKASRGTGNPKLFNQLLREKLEQN